MVVAMNVPVRIIKRNGLEVAFDLNKIKMAITNAFNSEDVANRRAEIADDSFEFYIDKLCASVLNILSNPENTKIYTVEEVQDIVEWVLLSNREYEIAKHYIIYRNKRAEIRQLEFIAHDVISAFKESQKYFPTQLQAFQFFDKYSRWNTSLGRRETWIETVDRTVEFLEELWNNQSIKINKFYSITDSLFTEIREAILKMEVMPSMRLLAMAGEAARRDNSVIYNCSYLPIDSLESFCEIMTNSMAGCGVGYSVEFANVNKLGIIPVRKNESKACHVVQDSAEGWVHALRIGLGVWCQGYDVDFDFKSVRPKGSVLGVKGGQASGPEPLRALLSFIRERIFSKQGKKLTTLDCHDIACAIGNAVVSGGVRRTALICLFDEDDQEMLHCKDGDFAKDNSQRWNANNSAVWKNVSSMTQAEFVSKINVTFESKRGEPGIFGREIAWNTMPERRRLVNAEYKESFGTNPCGEIVLRPRQFCNLSAVVARENDTREDLLRKVRLATIIGTIQSTATYFPNLSSEWRQNCEEERLLGVDITGQLDCNILQTDGEDIFNDLKDYAVQINAEYSEILGINKSTSVTCVKPSGNTSQLVNCSSGLHARHSEYYIRNVRMSATSPLAKVLQDAGFKLSPENGQDAHNPVTWVVSFPVMAPFGSIVKKNWDVRAQVDWWLLNKEFWTEHNPSVTITYGDDEVLTLMNLLWHNREMLAGVSILPNGNASYEQLPYIECTKEQYEEVIKNTPTNVDWARTYLYEKRDNTSASSTPACEGDICELPIQ